MKPLFSRTSLGERVFLVINVGLMLLVVVATVYPFLNALAISLNDSADSVKGGLSIFPRKPTLKNFETIFTYGNLVQAFTNSVLRTVIGAVLALIACSMIAYTLSRKEYRYRRQINLFLAVTMYVSGGLVSFFLLIRDLHLMNSFLVYILPGIVGAFNVIMIRSFMEKLPDELSESAFIDGASYWTVFFRIILPLSKPVLATIALFVAVGQWNSWFDTYLFNGSEPGLTTLMFELMKILQTTAAAGQDAMRNANALQNQSTVSPESIRMATTVVTIVPILVVYPFLQRYFVSGMTIGAVKG